MRKILFALSVALLAVAPAHATGGMTCRTAGASPIEVSVGFGHAPGSPLISSATRLLDNGRNVPVTAPQWWLDNSELRLLLVDPNAIAPQAVIKAERDGHVYDGSLWRHGKRRWVRCRES